MSFLPFDYRRHPPLFLMPLACMDILNSLIKCKKVFWYLVSGVHKYPWRDTCQELYETDTTLTVHTVDIWLLITKHRYI